MNFPVGTRICSKTGACYKVVETNGNVISLVNVQNSTVIAYKLEDLEQFLPAFSHDERPTCSSYSTKETGGSIAVKQG